MVRVLGMAMCSLSKCHGPTGQGGLYPGMPRVGSGCSTRSPQQLKQLKPSDTAPALRSQRCGASPVPRSSHTPPTSAAAHFPHPNILRATVLQLVLSPLHPT